MSRKTNGIGFGLVVCLLTFSGLGSAFNSFADFQSAAAVNDLIVYRIGESPFQNEVFCSVGNTQNVPDVGAQMQQSGLGVTAMKIDPGGDCTFKTSLDQATGTYHLQFRMRAEISPQNNAPATQITYRVLANFRTTDSLYYGIVAREGSVLDNLPTGGSSAMADRPYWMFELTNKDNTAVHLWGPADSMATYINFKNYGTERIYLDLFTMSSVQ